MLSVFPDTKSKAFGSSVVSQKNKNKIKCHPCLSEQIYKLKPAIYGLSI